jgi:ectoine hydroxylase-related dioxygenase (phytanoyl-CoA dioxygenase family)
MSSATASAPTTKTYDFLHDGWVEEYWDKGYTILRGVFTPEEITDLQRCFDRAYAEGMSHHATWRHQNRVFWVQNHEKIGRFVSGCQWQAWADAKIDAIRTDPRMLAILEPLIGNNVKQIINQCHWKTPGSGQTWGLHQDVRSRTPARCFYDLASSYVQTGIAVDRHWADNGAMKVIPYSHKRGDMAMETKVANRHGHRDPRDGSGFLENFGYTAKDLVDVEMQPGDVALWGPMMVHGGGINTTPDNFRRLLINGYVKAENCDRGQPVFHRGQPVPLTIPALIQYDDLYVRPQPHYATDSFTLVQRD